MTQLLICIGLTYWHERMERYCMCTGRTNVSRERLIEHFIAKYDLSMAVARVGTCAQLFTDRRTKKALAQLEQAILDFRRIKNW